MDLPELHDREKFCALIAAAREFKIPGWWEGSSYRHHPCGFYCDGLIFTNHWHVDRHCSIRVMRHPDEPLGTWCTDSFADADPTPHPASGTETVWADGEWRIKGPWVEMAVKILMDLSEAVRTARATRDQKAAEDELMAHGRRTKELEDLRARYEARE